MNAKIRFVIGFAVGLVVAGPAVLLTGAGHGTYAPLVAASSGLAFIPGIGILLAVFGAPVLWAVYFTFIPAIEPRSKRIIVLVLILLVHLVPGIWIASSDPAFTRQLQFNPAFVIVDGLTLCGAFILLALIGSSRKQATEVNR